MSLALSESIISAECHALMRAERADARSDERPSVCREGQGSDARREGQEHEGTEREFSSAPLSHAANASEQRKRGPSRL